MKKTLLGLLVLLGLSLASTAYAVPFTIDQGGTGTSTKPCTNCVLTGDSNGRYVYTIPGGGSSVWAQSGINAYFNLAGNVGIGSTTPSTKLVVSGTTTAAAIVATSTTANSSFAGPLSVAGQFLVGTNSSSYKAEIKGDMAVDGDTPSPILALGDFGIGNYSGMYEPMGGQFYSGYDTGANRYFYGSAQPGAGLTIGGFGSSAYFSNKLGVATSSPYAALSVVGEAVASNFTATSTTATSTFKGPVTLSDSLSNSSLLNMYTSGNNYGIVFNDVGNVSSTTINHFGDEFNIVVRGSAGVGAQFHMLNAGGIEYGAYGPAGTEGHQFITNTGSGDVLRMIIQPEGNIGIGTSTPVANFQATNITANATTTIEFGRAGQNKGTCIKLYNEVGTAYYLKVNSAGSLILSTTACASVTGF